MPGPLLLLDSASLYYRAFHGVPTTVTAPDGSPVNAVRGFLDMLTGLLTARRPAAGVACWDDDWRPAFRVRALPTYKSHRVIDPLTGAEATPELLGPQVPVIAEVLAAIGIARVGAPGFEADDVIATLATTPTLTAAPSPTLAPAPADPASGATPPASATEASVGGTMPSPTATSRVMPEVFRPEGVEIVTGDRDLFQLVDDEAGIRVLYTGRGMRRLETIDAAALTARYGVATGQAYTELSILRGDPSDGLPGVPGIGERSAAALLSRFGNLDGVLASLSELPPAQRARLEAARDYLAAARRVVPVVRDVPLSPVDAALPSAPPDPEALDALRGRWGLASPLKRLLEAIAATRTER